MSSIQQERHEPDRVPIITEIRRVPVLDEMTTDKAWWLYGGLVQYAANSTLRQAYGHCWLSVEDLCQEGAALLAKHVKKYGNAKSTEEFGMIFRASVWRYMRRTVSENIENHAPLETVSIDMQAQTSPDGGDKSGYGVDPPDEKATEALLSVETQEKVDRLYGVLDQYGQIRLKELLMELIEPSERSVWQANMHHARVETVRAQGARINDTPTFKITLTDIRRALDVEPKAFDAMLSKLRNYASYVFGKIDGEFTDGVERVPVLLPCRKAIL